MITVRAAVPADEDALSVVDQQTWTSSVSPSAPPPPGMPFFGKRNDVAEVLVAEVDDQIAGYVAVGPSTPLASNAHVFQVTGLAVAPRYQRLGVGERLVLAAVERAHSREARKLTLRVLGPNAGARRLYERCGFAVEGVLRQEFLLDGAYVDDVLMARDLDPPRP